MADADTDDDELTGTITVELRKDQAQALKELQSESGTYKTVVDGLLEDADASAGEIDVDALAETIATTVGQDVDTRLSRIEDRLDELQGR